MNIQERISKNHDLITAGVIGTIFGILLTLPLRNPESMRLLESLQSLYSSPIAIIFYTIGSDPLKHPVLWTVLNAILYSFFAVTCQKYLCRRWPRLRLIAPIACLLVIAFLIFCLYFFIAIFGGSNFE